MTLYNFLELFHGQRKVPDLQGALSILVGEIAGLHLELICSYYRVNEMNRYVLVSLASALCRNSIQYFSAYQKIEVEHHLSWLHMSQTDDKRQVK